MLTDLIKKKVRDKPKKEDKIKTEKTKKGKQSRRQSDI